MKNRVRDLLILIIIVGGYLILLNGLGFETKCVVKNVTGMPCPSCGMTRSYLHLFEGDLRGAFYYHPLFLTVPLVLVIIYLLSVKKDNKKLRVVLTVILYLIIALFIIVYIYRMILYFPDTEPLEFNDKGIIPTIIRSIRLVFD